MGKGDPARGAALRRIARALIAGIAFCLSASAVIPPAGGRMDRSGAGTHDFSPRYQYSSFCDDTALYAGAYAKARVPANGGDDVPILGGTITHHLFARDLTAEYFVRLAQRVRPKTIFILGPNHRARGTSSLALSALRWRTPFGFVEPDTDKLRAIAATGIAQIEEEPFVNEHSIGALVPFLRRSFPGVRIVPVIFKKIADRGDCMKLAGVISGLMDSALVLASLDFSHYRTSAEAEQEDLASLSVLRPLATDRIDEAYVDSRPALLTLMQICRLRGGSRVEVVQHTNSGIMSQRPGVPCTSYINTWIGR